MLSTDRRNEKCLVCGERNSNHIHVGGSSVLNNGRNTFVPFGSVVEFPVPSYGWNPETGHKITYWPEECEPSGYLNMPRNISEQFSTPVNFSKKTAKLRNEPTQ